MYFVDLKGLCSHLRNQKNSEYENFQYLVGYIILACLPLELFFELTAYTKPVPNDTSSTFVTVFGTVGGSTLAGIIGYLVLRSYFRSNGGSAGKDFLPRFLSLTWVLGWRISFVLWPAYFIGWLYVISNPLAVFAIVLLLLLVCAVYYFVKMNQALQEIHAATQTQLIVEVGG